MVSLRGRDVLCAGMYRACSTWQYEVAAHLVEKHQGGQRLGYLASGEYTALLLKEDADCRTAWRVIKSHEGEPSMARELLAGRARALYVHRDVRDVVFSLMHKRGKTFEQILRQGMIHQILANDRFWMAQPNVLVQRYDDLVSEPVLGVMDLADHLGIRAGGWRGRADRETLLAGIEPGSNRGPQTASRASGRGSRQHWQHADLRPVVALALEPHEAERRSLVAHNGDTRAGRHHAPAMPPVAQGAWLLARSTTALALDFHHERPAPDASR